MLCQTCKNMFQGNPLFVDDHSHHYTPYDLEQAALEGCYICDVLWRRYQFRRSSLIVEEAKATDSGESGSKSGKSNFSLYSLDFDASPVELGIFLNIYFDLGLELYDVIRCSLCTFYLRPTSGTKTQASLN